MSATTWLIIAIVGFSLSGVALVAAVLMFIKMNIPAVIGDLTGKTVAREIKAMRSASASGDHKNPRAGSVGVNHEIHAEKSAGGEIGRAVRAEAHASKRLDRTGSDQPYRLEKGQTGQSAGTVSKGGRATESLSANVAEVDIEERRSTSVLSQNRVTDVLAEDRKTDILSEPSQTAILSEARQTEVLSQARQMETPSQARQTEVLSQARQTEILSQARQTEILVGNESAIEERAGTTVLSDTEEVTQEDVKPVAFKITKSVVLIHTDEVIG